MKILIIVHNLTGGGAERVASSWANGLYELGHDVSIMTDQSNQTYRIKKGINIIQQKILYKDRYSFYPKLMRKIFQPIVSFSQLFSYFRNSPPDAVVDILYHLGYPTLFARILSFRQFPIIMTDHNVFERPKEAPFKWRQWKNKFIDNRLYDWTTVLTKPDKKILNEKGISTVSVINNPLFLNPVSTIPYKKNTILAVGRLDQWYVKGFDLLISAWGKIYDKYPDWSLRIVGAGLPNTIDWLRSLSPQDAPIEFIDFTSDIEKEYSSAAIYVLPSRFEGWGLVAVEAMSQGCATIACDFKGRQAEFIMDNKNGLLCKTDDMENLLSAMKRLIEDVSLRTRLQQSAPISVAKFSEYNVAKNLESIITLAIAKKRKSISKH